MHILASLCLLVAVPLMGMKDKNVLKLLAVIVAAFGFQAVAAAPMGNYFAHSVGEGCPFMDNETFAEMSEFHEEVQAAIESNNYTAWKAALNSLLTEERFNEIVELHNRQQEQNQLMEEFRNAWEEGDYEKIAEIRANLSDSGAMPEPKGNAQGISRGLGNAWGHVKQAFGKLAFWRH